MSKPYVYAQQQPILRRQWESMHITRKGAEMQTAARRLLAAKDDARLLQAERQTGVPWYLILIIFEREAGGPPHFWDRNIAQGDRWNAVSQHEPTGRGPFTSWAAAAYDALVTLKGYDKLSGKWSVERILFTLQPYNGLGYFFMGIPSPYVWSCCDQYDPPAGPGGKYTSDHHFTPGVVDEQIGCAPLLKTLMELDATIRPPFEGGAQPDPAPIPVPVPIPVPTPTTVPDQDVVWLQGALNRLGEKPPLVIDGYYGRSTMEAVRRFQRAHGLDADGISGPVTESAVRTALAKPQPNPHPAPVAGGILVALAILAHFLGAHPAVPVVLFIGAIGALIWFFGRKK